MMPGDPVVGGVTLRRPAIASPDYVADTSGWSINADGSAEFNNLTIRGTFNGTDYVINSTGIFLYSSAPAAGNLVNSITNFSGTDPYGNHYLTGSASYGNSNGQAVANVDGVLFFYTGSLAAGWTQQGSIQADTTNPDQIDTEGNAQISGNLIVQGTALTVNGTNIIAALSGQPTTTNGLPNGGIAGTSGSASAGTAHTHGPGSYSVTDGQHSHDLPAI